jgi:membrane-bound metal-dependent hydrolase YbcI (DUF457 family)
MPTPIGHALAGLAIAGVGRRVAPFSTSQVGWMAVLACAPDLDLTLRLVDGVNHHRGPTHSMGAALLAGVVVWILRRLGVASVPGGLSATAAWASHVALDYTGVDTSPPFGEMALWPFSDGFYISPIPIFLDVPRAISVAAIRHNLMAVAIEVVVLMPIVWISWRQPKDGRPA